VKRLSKVGTGRYPIGYGLQGTFFEWLSESDADRPKRLDVLIKAIDPKDLVGETAPEILASILKQIYPKLSEVAHSGFELERIAKRTAGRPSFVDKILKGAESGDLPIEQAAKFQFIVNPNTYPRAASPCEWSWRGAAMIWGAPATT
jgi:hypothetical protein